MYDLPSAPEVITAFGTLLAGSAACFGAFIAFKGLSSWRDQRSWEADSELARKILILLYRHRDAISHVRNPAIWVDESEAVLTEEDKKEDRDFQRYLGTAKVYEKRWEKITSVRSELYPLLLEADAIWQGEAKDMMMPLHELEVELKITVQRYLRATNPRITEETRRHAEKRLNQKRDVLYEDYSPDDEFKTDYQTRLESIERFLQSKMVAKNDFL